MIYTLILIATLQAPGPAISTSKAVAGTFQTCSLEGAREVRRSKLHPGIFKTMRFECIPTRKGSSHG